MKAIRSFLLMAVSLMVILVLLLSSWLSFYKAQYEVDELFDAELAQTSRILRSTMAVASDPDRLNDPQVSTVVSTHDWAGQKTGAGTVEEERTVFGHSYERKIMFRVQQQERVVLASDNSPLSGDMPLQAGYQFIRTDGHDWHLFTLVDDDTFYTVGERSDVREELIRKIAFSNLYPTLLGLPVLLLLVAVVLRRGLRPLAQLDQHIRERDKDNLDPIPLTSTPEEISPIVDSLNGLLMRLRRSLDSERRFTATASHEMRTPIAVLKINVQNALKTPDGAERTALLHDLDAGVDRAGRLINQLLALYRLEQDDQGFVMTEVDVLPVLREEIASLYPLALDKRQSLELVCEEETMVIRTALQIFPLLIRNLVDNAIKYSPRGGRILVSVRRVGGQVRLQVEDSGPGVPVAERQKILMRFYRAQSATATGSGLGLAIVARVVELLHGSIEIGSSNGLAGLSVTVVL